MASTQLFFEGQAIILFPCPSLAAVGEQHQHTPPPSSFHECPMAMLNPNAHRVMSARQVQIFESILVTHGVRDLIVASPSTASASTAAMRGGGELLAVLTSLKRKARRRVIIVTESRTALPPPRASGFGGGIARAPLNYSAASSTTDPLDAVTVLSRLLVCLEEAKAAAVTNTNSRPYTPLDAATSATIRSREALVAFRGVFVVVGHEWLSACASQRCLVPTEQYAYPIVMNTITAGAPLSAPPPAAAAKTSLPPLLASGIGDSASSPRPSTAVPPPTHSVGPPPPPPPPSPPPSSVPSSSPYAFAMEEPYHVDQHYPTAHRGGGDGGDGEASWSVGPPPHAIVSDAMLCAGSSASLAGSFDHHERHQQRVVSGAAPTTLLGLMGMAAPPPPSPPTVHVQEDSKNSIIGGTSGGAAWPPSPTPHPRIPLSRYHNGEVPKSSFRDFAVREDSRQQQQREGRGRQEGVVDAASHSPSLMPDNSLAAVSMPPPPPRQPRAPAAIVPTHASIHAAATHAHVGVTHEAKGHDGRVTDKGGFIQIFFGAHAAPPQPQVAEREEVVVVEEDEGGDAMGGLGAPSSAALLTATAMVGADVNADWAPFDLTMLSANAAAHGSGGSSADDQRLHAVPVISPFATDRMRRQLAYIDKVQPFAIQKPVGGGGGAGHTAGTALIASASSSVPLGTPHSSGPADRLAKDAAAAPNQHLIDELARLKEVYSSTGDHWRSYAYNRAIGVIKRYRGGTIVTGEEVRCMTGIGEKLYLKIKEILATGTSSKLTRLKASPEVQAIETFTRVWGIGPTTAKKIASMRGVRWDDAGAQRGGGGEGGRGGEGAAAAASAADVNPFMRFITDKPSGQASPSSSAAAAAGGTALLYRTIEDLRRMPPSFLSSSQRLGLAYMEDLEVRIPRAEVDAIADAVIGALRRLGFDANRAATDKRLMLQSGRGGSGSGGCDGGDCAKQQQHKSRHPLDVVVCGSYRRGKASSGDVDVLICDRTGRRTDGILRLLVGELKKGIVARPTASSAAEGVKAERDSVASSSRSGDAASSALSLSSSSSSHKRLPFLLAELTTSFKSQREASCDTWFGIVQLPDCGDGAQCCSGRAVPTGCSDGGDGDGRSVNDQQRCPCAHRGAAVPPVKEESVKREEVRRKGEAVHDADDDGEAWLLQGTAPPTSTCGANAPPPTFIGAKREREDSAALHNDDGGGASGGGGGGFAAALAGYRSYHNLGRAEDDDVPEPTIPPPPLSNSVIKNSTAAKQPNSTRSSVYDLDESDGEGEGEGAQKYAATDAFAALKAKHKAKHEGIAGTCASTSSASSSAAPIIGYSAGLHYARRLDMKVYPADQFPFAVLYFTGSDYFNRSMRLYCHKRGLSLSDHGLVHVIRDARRREVTHEGSSVVCYTERDIFDAIGLPYRLPHERDL